MAMIGFEDGLGGADGGDGWQKIWSESRNHASALPRP
jgi:hypothetical protein